MPQEYWQPWNGPTGTTGIFLGVTGAVTGPAFFGVTGATGPTGTIDLHDHVKFLYNRARTRLVGASDSQIREIIWEVFHEFFQDSSCWSEIIPGNLIANVSEYWLEPGNPQSLGDPFPVGRIIRFAGCWDFNHFPIIASMPEPPILKLLHPQTQTVPAHINVIKNVRIPHGYDDLPHVPYWVVEGYETRLLSGVLGKMMLQSNRPYTDQKSGQLHYQMFRQGVNMARVAAMRKNTLGGNAWFYPQQYRTVSQRGGVTFPSDGFF